MCTNTSNCSFLLPDVYNSRQPANRHLLWRLAYGSPCAVYNKWGVVVVVVRFISVHTAPEFILERACPFCISLLSESGLEIQTPWITALDMLAARNKINRSPELYSLTTWNTEKVTIFLGFPVDSFYLLLNFRWNHTACSWCMGSYHYIMMFMHKVYSYVLPCTANFHPPIVSHVCNPSTVLRQFSHEVKDSLDYSVRPCLQTKKQKHQY